MSTGRLGAGDTAIQPTILDAKGDLIVATAADTPARLAVGSANQVLTVDSSTATGLKWAAAASGTAMGANVYNSTFQTVPNTTDTLLTFDSERFDTDGIHSTSSNTGRLTVPSGKGGKWLVAFNAAVAILGTGFFLFRVKKNGGSYVLQMRQYGSSTYQHNCALAAPLDLAAGDYVELFLYHNNGGNEQVYTSGEYGFFSMMRLGD